MDNDRETISSLVEATKLFWLHAFATITPSQNFHTLLAWKLVETIAMSNREKELEIISTYAIVNDFEA
jgi:hypothetical protein